MNIWDILILAAIGIVLFFALRTAVRNRKNCCGNCRGCEKCGGSCPSCHAAKMEDASARTQENVAPSEDTPDAP